MTALVLDVERRFPGGAALAAALTIPLDSAVTVLFGPSGAGKSTLLRLVAGLDVPDRGAIRFGEETWVEPGRFVPPQRRGVGLLFQDLALFPHLTAGENIGYGLAALPRPERAARVAALAARFGVADLVDRRPALLSGGERQRVALARALAPRPRLLLLDEPLTALDLPARERLRGELRALLRGAGVPSIVVTHDRTEALALGDRLAVLTGGRVRQVGPVEEVFTHPADLAVAEAVGTDNVVAGRVVRLEDGLAEVETGGARLWGLPADGLQAGAPCWALLRAEDIVLERAPGAETSARNELTGTVAAVVAEGPLARVTLESGGFRLAVLVTRASASRLAVAPGLRVAALVKAQAVRVLARGGG